MFGNETVRTFEPYQRIALMRFGTQAPSALIARDHRHLGEIEPAEYVGKHFELVLRLLCDGRPVPETVVPLARQMLAHNDPAVRVRSAALLVRFEESRAEAIDALVRWVDGVEAPVGVEGSAFFSAFLAPQGISLVGNLCVFGHGFVYGHGWGREKQREYLPPLAGALLRKGEWSLEMWRTVLGPPLLSGPRPSDTDLDARARDIFAEHFFRLANDTHERLVKRQAAIAAIGRMGAALFAKDLGRFNRDSELKDVARQAQRQLRDVDRVGDLPVELALDLGVRGFLEAVS